MRGKMGGSEKIWRRHMHRGAVIDGDASGMEGEKRNIMFSDLGWSAPTLQ